MIIACCRVGRLSDSVCVPHIHCSSFRLVTVVPLLFISLQLLGRAANMGVTKWSPVFRAFTRSRKVGVQEKVRALGVRFGGRWVGLR